MLEMWTNVAKEYGLTMDADETIYYGNYRGFALTLDRGFDQTYRLGFTGHFPSEAAKLAVKKMIESWDWKEDRIVRIVVNVVTVRIEFEDHKELLSSVEGVMDRLISLLEESAFAGEGYCACCGRIVEGDGFWNTDVDEAYYLHRGCAEAFQDIRYDIEEEMAALLDEEEQAELEAKNSKGIKGVWKRLFKS